MYEAPEETLPRVKADKLELDSPGKEIFYEKR